MSDPAAIGRRPRFQYPARTHADDLVAVEEPVEIRVDGEALAVLMRTPGRDRELVAGFLWTEGIIDAATDLRALAPCQDPNVEHAENVMLALLAEGCGDAAERLRRARRTLVTGSSCGVCGKAAIQNLLVEVPAYPRFAPLEPAWIAGVDALARREQPAFSDTGGLHAAALFGPPPARDLLGAAEDVGRHNAVDKVLGAGLLDGRLPIDGAALWVSGRASFEIVQKVLRGGIRTLICVGAPTTMAIDLARESCLTLVGFARAGRFNVYAAAP
jgi:FdhD protein